MQWVKKKTEIPVPNILGFDDNNKNGIGFEWILMEYMPGTTARKRWRTMSMSQKAALVKRLARFQYQLSGLKEGRPAFESIGTLEAPSGPLETNDEKVSFIAPGTLVSYEFFAFDHLEYDIPRGPFSSSHDWLDAVLRCILRHQTSILECSKDEDDVEDAEEVLAAAQSLRALLSVVFPSDIDGSEPSVLLHHDLNLNNILVNNHGEITAVLDWECVSAMPLWMMSRVPEFLECEPREHEPLRDDYAAETSEETAMTNHNDAHYLDNEGKNELYWIHKMEYEATQLRKVYTGALKELCPERAEAKALQIDFYEAVGQCDGLWTKMVRRWVESIEKGKTIRFRDVWNNDPDSVGTMS